MFVIHYLTYFSLFLIVLTEKDKFINAIKDDFYHKVIEAKCTKVAARRCIKISKNSQENTCPGVSFLIKFLIKGPATLIRNRLWHRCFHVNF